MKSGILFWRYPAEPIPVQSLRYGNPELYPTFSSPKKEKTAVRGLS